MSDCIITVESSSIIVASQEDCEVTIIPSETAVTVIPGRTNETTVSLTTPEVIITPTVFDPYIDQSYGVQDLYIFIIDIEQLEIWQHNLNTVSDLVDALIIRCQAIEDNIDNVETDIASIEDDIRLLQTDAVTLSTRVDTLILNYNTLSALVDQHTLLIANLGGDINNLNQLFINLNTSLDSLDGRISANASLINLQEVSITQNTDGLEILAISMTALGVSISDLEAGYTANSNAIQSLQADIVTIHGEVIATASSITALDSTISGLDGRIDVNATAVDSMYTEVNDLSGQFSALSAHTTELIAEVPSTFNPALAWEFIADLEGWVSGGSATLIFDVDSAKITGDGHAEVTFDDPVAGLQNSVVTLRWKCTLDINPFIGEIYYRYTGDAGSFVLGGSFSHIYGYSEYRQSTIDCDWGDKAITAIAVKFSTGGTFLIDSIGIGYKTGFGAMAYIREQSVAWVTESEAYVNNKNALWAQVGENTGNIVIESEIDAKIADGVKSTWSLKVNAEDATGSQIVGMWLTAATGVTTTRDFQIVSENFFITNALTGSVRVFDVHTDPVTTNSYIKLGGDVRIVQDIRSENYNNNPGSYAGWEIAQDGTANFHGINIYNTSGDLILSSGAGIESSGLVANIEDDMATALLGSSTTANQFNADYYAGIKSAIETDSLTYIRTAMIDDLFTNTAYIKNAHILNLEIGTSKIAAGAVTDFTFLTQSGLPTSYTNLTTLISTVMIVPSVQKADLTYVAAYARYDINFAYEINWGASADDQTYIEVWRDAVSTGTRLIRRKLLYSAAAVAGFDSDVYQEDLFLSFTDGPEKSLTSGNTNLYVVLRPTSGAVVEVQNTELTIQFFKR